jgi:hypothetical protein
MKPYTYLLKCIPTQELYYGVRYSAKCKPEDFWNSYFTSSKIIAKRIEQFGKDSFQFEIRQTFDDPYKARLWENKVIQRMKMVEDSRFLNQSDGIHYQFRSTNEGKKFFHNPTTKEYSLFFLENAPDGWILQGMPKSNSMKEAVRKFQQNYTRTAEHQANLSASTSAACSKFKDMTLEERYGDERAAEIKLNMSTAQSGRESSLKGKTYEEIMGKEKAAALLKKKSTLQTGDKNFGTIKKGSTYEETFGKEKANKLKAAKSKPNLKNRKTFVIHTKDGNHIIVSSLRELYQLCAQNDEKKGGLYATLSKNNKTRKGNWITLFE